MSRPRPSTAAPRTVALPAVALLLLAAACASGPAVDPAPSAVPGFPAEPTAADFPGLRYPAFDGPLPAPGGLHGPVWLIGVDGATWDLLGPWAERGELPHFQALMERGAHGVLVSEDPTISPAVWATIATGVPRFVHGIVNFTVRRPGSYKTIEAGPPDRRTPAVWELVGAAGGRSAVLSWFGSYPAEPIEGVYLSKRFDPERLQPGQVHPASFAPTLRERARVKLLRGELDAIGCTEEFRKFLLDDARTLAALQIVADTERPQLVAAYFAGIDVAQHLTWRHMDPASNAFPEDGEPDPVLARVIPAYYRYVDRMLGEIVRLAGPEATLVVVSDHGGGPMRRDEATLLQLPVFLEEVGIVEQGVAFAISELYRHEKRIWLNLEGVEPKGIVPLDQADAVAQRIRGVLERLRTGDGGPVFVSVAVHTGDPAWQPGDPALTVRVSHAARAAAEVFDGQRGIDMSRVRFRVPGNSGSHRPEGVMLLAGPGIRPGPLDRPASIYQVAPTVLYLLGLPQDARMLRHAPPDGGVLVEAIDPGLLERRPVRMVEAYPGTDRTHLLRAAVETDAAQDPTHDEAMEKLKSLGYIR